MIETVEITRLGHAGDGVAADGLFVPYTVPGDVVRVTRIGARAHVEDIVTPGPWRTAPLCGHFGRCGGCALQMMARGPYLDWKRDLVVNALRQRGFAEAPVEAIRAIPPGRRRRAMFKARGMPLGVALGFYAPESRKLVDIGECPVLVPALERLIQPMKSRLSRILNTGETAELHATATDSGIDLSLKLSRARGPDILNALSEFASALNLARLTWNGELVALARTPSLRMRRFTVTLPPEAFLQPTVEGERMLQTLVCEAAGGAKNMADLFAGCGSFALPLADGRSVHAVEIAGAQLDALADAAKAGKAQVTTEARDLFRRPLLPSELKRLDAVILDPPRPGAAAQAQALAQSAVPNLLYVSCSPATFARDARSLCDGGYRLARVVPVDQFLWSPHVELFAHFTRE